MGLEFLEIVRASFRLGTAVGKKPLFRAYYQLSTILMEKGLLFSLSLLDFKAKGASDAVREKEPLLLWCYSTIKLHQNAERHFAACKNGYYSSNDTKSTNYPKNKAQNMNKVICSANSIKP